MQRATEFGSLVSALGAGVAVQKLTPVEGASRINVKTPQIVEFSSSGAYLDQLKCLRDSLQTRTLGTPNCQVKRGVLGSLAPVNRKGLPGEWEYLAGATKAVANFLEASPEDQGKAYGVLLSSRQIMANIYETEFDNLVKATIEPLHNADPLGGAAGTRFALVTLLLLLGFVRELARYN